MNTMMNTANMIVLDEPLYGRGCGEVCLGCGDGLGFSATPVHFNRVLLLRCQFEEGVDVVEHDPDRDGVLIRAGADSDPEKKLVV